MDFSINDPFSIEMWIKTTINTAELVSNVINDSPATGFITGIIGGNPYFYMGSNYPISHVYVTATTNCNDNNWHHLAFTYNGTTLASGVSIYIDGVLQTVSISSNNLSGNATSGAPYNIGSRNNLNYFYSGLFDEVRIWKKALCVTEINARKNCQLVGNEPLLVAYYNFNLGVAGGTNTITNLPDISSTGNTGTLTGFALSGATSNWVASTTSISGTCSYNYVAIAGNTTICNGSTTTLTASGATTYSWYFGSTLPSVVLSPSTTYTLNTTSASNCSGNTIVTVNVNPNPIVVITSLSGSICSGQSINLMASGANTYLWNTSAATNTIVVSPTVSSTYSVTGTNSLTGCSNVSSMLVTVEICTGITINQTNAEELIFFPNPSNGNVTLKAAIDLDVSRVC
jgi:hypothetical protein